MSSFKDVNASADRLHCFWKSITDACEEEVEAVTPDVGVRRWVAGVLGYGVLCTVAPMSPGSPGSLVETDN